jgi:hypothetical protein
MGTPTVSKRVASLDQQARIDAQVDAESICRRKHDLLIWRLSAASPHAVDVRRDDVGPRHDAATVLAMASEVVVDVISSGFPQGFPYAPEQSDAPGVAERRCRQAHAFDKPHRRPPS